MTGPSLFIVYIYSIMWLKLNIDKIVDIECDTFLKKPSAGTLVVKLFYWKAK